MIMSSDVTVNSGFRTGSPRSIAFVDGNIAHADDLLPNIKADQIVQLSAIGNGVEEITQILSQHQGLESVHVFSHGSRGAIQLGDTTLSQSFLGEYKDDLEDWGNALLDKADVFLYGCDVAVGEEGQAFVEQLSQLTGADVAASTDITGQDGNWFLEVTVGDITHDSFKAVDYKGNLATKRVIGPATAAYHNFSRQRQTPLGSTDQGWSFAQGDYNNVGTVKNMDFSRI